MNRFHFTLGLLIALCSPLLAADAPVAHADPAAAAKLISTGNVIVLDVRTPNEFTGGHIDGAKNIDFTEDDFKAKVAALDKTKPYLVHCASGGRSTKSLKVFQELGFTHITHLDGGFNAWKAAGQKVAK